jgi:hypothetical protein
VRALLVLIALASPAFADDAQSRATAEQHWFAGKRAYTAQNFAAAATNFEEAFKAMPRDNSPKGEKELGEIAYAAAQAYRRWYRIDPKLDTARRAAELYRFYLDRVKTGGKVGVAADYVGEMQREVDKLVAAGAKVARESAVERTRLGVSPVLSIEQRGGGIDELADLPDATQVEITATIDGKPVQPFELIDVEPGPHKIHVEAEGYLPHDTTERAVKGSSKVAEIVMKPKPAKLVVKTERDAKLRVDGRAAAGTTLELPAGKHVVTILKSGREAVSREVELGRGQELAIDAPLEKTARRRAVPFVAAGAIVLGAATLAGTTYAIVEHVRAGDQLAAIDKGDQRPEAADRYEALIARRNEVTTGALITGGAALLVGGAALALYWLDSPSEETVRVTPVIGGVSVRGRF